MFHLNSLYMPIVSRPFLRSATYAEYPAGEALRPFVRCYWGTAGSQNTPPCGKSENISHENGRNKSSSVLVVPDSCMDLIIEINHTSGTISASFSGMQDKPFFSQREANSSAVVSRFAVRFYFWAAHLFTNCIFKEIYNTDLDADYLFPGWKNAFEPFFYITDIYARINIAEQYLQKQLALQKQDNRLFNAIYAMLNSGGAATVANICSYSGTTPRQLQRMFEAHIGLPPKKAAGLVRYQNIWRSMALSPSINIHDTVEKYGYTDQSHLLNEFRRYHGVNPKQALQIARAAK